jgi:two-component system response regulator
MGRSLLLVVQAGEDAALLRKSLALVSSIDQLLIAHDEAEALALADGPWPPCAVLLQLDGRLQGLELVHRLRGHEATRHLPIITLCAAQDDATIRACYAAGANSYLRRSEDPEVSRKMLETLVDYWCSFNTLPNAPGVGGMVPGR